MSNVRIRRALKAKQPAEHALKAKQVENFTRALKIGTGGSSAIIGLVVLYASLDMLQKSHGLRGLLMAPAYSFTSLLSILITFSGAHLVHSGFVKTPLRPIETVVVTATLATCSVVGINTGLNCLKDRIDEQERRTLAISNYFGEFFGQNNTAPTQKQQEDYAERIKLGAIN